MNADALLQHYERIADAPDAIARLRRFVLDLAVRGKLVPPDPKDEPASDLLKRISIEKARMRKSGEIRIIKSLPSTKSAPFHIPSGWRWTRIAEIGLLSPRNDASDSLQASFVPVTLVAAEYGVEHGHAIRPWGEIKKGYTHFADGDVGLAKITPCFENGKSTVFRKLSGGIGSGTTELHVVRPVFVLPDYVVLFLKSPHFIETGVPKMTGTAGQKRVPTEYFAHSPFPLPPLAEQHRIVAKVDELMALCDRLEAARAEREAARDRLAAASLARLNAPDPETFAAAAYFALNVLPALTSRPDQIKQLRQTIFNLAVRGRLSSREDTEGSGADLLATTRERRRKLALRLRNPGPKTVAMQLAIETEMYEQEQGNCALPDHWIWAPALDLCERVDSGSTPPAGEMFDGAGEIPVIKVYNLTKNGSLDFSVKPTFVSRGTHGGKLARSRILPGDVLMNIVGPPLGKVSIVPNNFPEWNTNQAVVLFRSFPEVLAPYFAICLLSTDVLSWITDLAQQTVGQINISVSKSRRLPIPLPPMAEQRRIVAAVDELMSVCDRLEASLSSGEDRCRHLLEALLNEALQPAKGLEQAA